MIIDFSNEQLYNKKYIPLLYDTKRYNFLMGGGGSGKSVFISQREIIKSFEIKDKIMCVRKIKDTLKDSMYAELKARITEWELTDYFDINKSPLSIINKLTGCEFIFRGLDDSEKLKSVQGVARVWIEEATELKKEDFDQIDLRLRGKDNMQITCTFNPTDAEHFLNTDFWINGNTEKQTCLHSTYTDNIFVGPEYKTVMDRLIETNYNYYKIYALGEWGLLEGLVFEKFNILQSIPDGAKFLGYGQDFGYTNDPTSLIGVYLFNNELIFDELIYEKGLTNQDIVEKYKELNISKSDDIFADSSEPKSIEEIHREGYNIKPVNKGPDSIMFGINKMKEYKINITSRSGNLQKEFKKYVWAKDKNGKSLNKPIDGFNHGIDAGRYLVMMKLGKSVEIFVGAF